MTRVHSKMFAPTCSIQLVCVNKFYTALPHLYSVIHVCFHSSTLIRVHSSTLLYCKYLIFRILHSAGIKLNYSVLYCTLIRLIEENALVLGDIFNYIQGFTWQPPFLKAQTLRNWTFFWSTCRWRPLLNFKNKKIPLQNFLRIHLIFFRKTPVMVELVMFFLPVQIK